MQEIRSSLLLTIGVVLAALGYSVFQVPYNIAAGGLSGLAIIINHFTGWMVGIVYFVTNVPLLILGFFTLGRWPFIIRTVLAVIIFSVAADAFTLLLPRFLPTFPVTRDILLCAVYAGMVGGIGNGFVYRAGATMGGTAIVGRIVQLKTGMPLSQIYLYTDGVIVLIAGLVFGWELALYAMLTLVLSGLASDYVLEGPSSIRTAHIVTSRTSEVCKALTEGLGRNVDQWQIVGSAPGEARAMVTCTVFRPQVNDLKRIVAQTDPRAFVTILAARQALGSNTVPVKR